MLNIRAKCIGFPIAILNQNIRTERGCRLYCIACRLVYSLFYHILFSPVTDCTENKHYKRSIYLSDFLLYHTPISGIIDHYCIMGNLKKTGKTKNKLKTIYPKNHESFKSSKPRVQFYWFL